MQSINTEEDARKFLDGAYDDEALDYLYKNDTLHYTAEERLHTLRCLKSIVAHLFGLRQAGDFGQALLRNDLRETVLTADGTNRKCLFLYIIFLANKVPAKRLWDTKKELIGGKA